MCVAVIGGMDRLDQQYKSAAAQLGIKLKVFTRSRHDLDAKLKHVDALLIFTNKVSHRARNEALKAVKSSQIPVMQMHSCGICTLRNGLNCLINQQNESASSGH